MPTLSTLADFEQLDNYHLHWKAENVYTAACPFPHCSSDEDGFHFWPDVGNYWCRKCGVKGFMGSVGKPDPAQIETARQKQLKRERLDRAEKVEKVKLLTQNNNVMRYHGQLTEHEIAWWAGKGINRQTIKDYQLGYTSNCPTAPGVQSYTIPIRYSGKLYNIRHRLKDRLKDKYRPEMAGLPNFIFNADILKYESSYAPLIIVEGEIKAMVLRQWGYEAIGIPGAGSFKPRWVSLFPQDRPVHIVMDPGAEEAAENIWTMLGSGGMDARLCRVPEKPDDLFVLYGIKEKEFEGFLRLGRPF